MTRSSFKPIFLFLILFAGPQLSAQIDSALGFLPLGSDDMHQFEFHYRSCSGSCFPCSIQTYQSYHIEEVVGDTTLPTGYSYKIIESNMPQEPQRQYLRVDTASANVYAYTDYPSPREYLSDSLRATTGSWFIRDGFAIECTGVDTMTVLGFQTVVKSFHVHYIPFGADYVLAYGLGRSQFVTGDDGGCMPPPIFFYRDLVYARIDGQGYGTFVGVDDKDVHLPSSLELRQNYPNPFNAETILEFSNPQPQWITLGVFNLLGQRVAEIFEGHSAAGIHQVRWSAAKIPSGVYICRLRSESQSRARKLILVK